MAAHTGVHIQTFSAICSPRDLETTITSVTNDAHTFVEGYQATGVTFSMATTLTPVSKYQERLCFTITILIVGTAV